MTKRHRLTAILATAVVLVSCGGGSDEVGSSPTPAASPTPNPSPSPTPSPTPSPSPSPSGTAYPTYAALTGDQRFATGCSALAFTPPPFQVLAMPRFGEGLTLAYDATAQRYTLTGDASVPFGDPRTYGSADRDPSPPARSSGYVKTTNGFTERLLIGLPEAAGVTPDYWRGLLSLVPLNGAASAGATQVQYNCVFGVPTRSDDAAGTSRVAYTKTGFRGTAYATPAIANPTIADVQAYSLSGSEVTLTYEVASRQVTFQIHVLGVLQTASGPAATTTDLGTYSGTASITAGATSFRAGLLSADRTINGQASFGGWFFGPAAAEAGVAVGIAIQDAGGRSVAIVGNAAAVR